MRGGAVGVGRAVNAAVVAAAVSIMLLDFFLTYLTGMSDRTRIANVGGVVVDAAARRARAVAGLRLDDRRHRARLPAQRARRSGEVARQMYSIGNRSLVFIIVTLGFIGMVMTYEACLQLVARHRRLLADRQRSSSG